MEEEEEEELEEGFSTEQVQNIQDDFVVRHTKWKQRNCVWCYFALHSVVNAVKVLVSCTFCTT